MRRALVAVVVVGLLLASCGGTKAAAPTTSIASTTSSTTTVASTTSTTSTSIAPSTTAATTTTTTPNGDWTPPCTPYAGGPTPSPGPYAEASLDTFGPLATQPSLTVTVPTGPTLSADGPKAPWVHAARVEGGVLLAVSASSSGTSKSSILAVVNTDGSKRWVRCISGQVTDVWVGPPAGRPTTATLTVLQSATATVLTYDWPIVSLIDGSTKGNVSDAARAVGVDPTDLAHYWVQYTYPVSPTKVVLAHAPLMYDTEHLDHLLVYDLTTNSVDTLPIPPELVSPTMGAGLGFSLAGEPIVANTSAVGGPERVLAVYRNGAWTNDQAVAQSVFGVRALLEVVAPFSLVGVDATGKVVWRDANFTAPQLQGMFVVSDGGVSVTGICTNQPATPPCTYALVGVDSSTGKLLWSLPGFRFVPAFSNGYVLANDATVLYSDDGNPTPGWVLLNAATGTIVDASQNWSDPDAFRQGCCGEGEYVWVNRSGGVVIAVNNTKVNVWYPKAVAPLAHTVSIP
jgi:hypothetical protein